MFSKNYIVIPFLFLLISMECPAQDRDLPSPANLSAEFIRENDTSYVLLKWDKVTLEDKNVGYNIFLNFPPEEKLFLYGKAGVVWNESYRIPIFNEIGSTYSFSVCSIVNFPKVIRSEKAPVLKFTTPTTDLPLLKLSKFSKNDHTVQIEWAYPNDIIDLKGFELIVNEEVKMTTVSEKRSLSYQLEEKGNYNLSLRAITKNGIKSNQTQLRRVIVD